MTATNHALTGVVVALSVKQPILAIPLALLSHFVIDAIPHFDAGPKNPRLTKVFIFSDITIAVCLTVFLSQILTTDVQPWLIFICAVAGMSPDLIWGWRYFKFKDFRKVITEPMSTFSKYHQRIQWSESRPGITVEVLWLLLMTSLINRISN